MPQILVGDAPQLGEEVFIGYLIPPPPFLFGYGDTHFATSNMIFGAIVVLGVGTIFYELYHKERFEKEIAGGMERIKERA